MDGLHLPAVRDVLIRKIVKQSGFDGARAHAAEIVRCEHDAAAEVILPYAVHHDAGGQRIRRIGDPVRKASAGLLDIDRLFRRTLRQQDTQRPCADRATLL